MTVKNMTLRLPREQAEELEIIARVDGVPMSETIREALQEHARQRFNDPDFRARLQQSRDRLDSQLGNVPAVE